MELICLQPKVRRTRTKDRDLVGVAVATSVSGDKKMTARTTEQSCCSGRQLQHAW